MIKKCKRCNNDFITDDKRRKFCGKDCFTKYQANNPNEGTFKKNSEPWNKGTKGVMKPNKTSFKKGQVGVNHKNVGEITIVKDKSGTSRNYIKVNEPNIWIPYAKFLWLEAFRELKANYVLHHKNNRSDDDRLENLMLVTRTEHPKLHSRWNTKNIAR